MRERADVSQRTTTLDARRLSHTGTTARRERWRRDHEPPAPPAHERLHHFFEATCDRTPDSVALECDGRRLTYRDLDQHANRLANHLLATGLKPGSRVGILVQRSVAMYAALLAALKVDATFVPIDPSAPADRVRFIAGDSALDLVLTTSDFADVCRDLTARVVHLDTVEQAVAEAPARRPELEALGDPTCYILYTSGSSGRPKGVEVAQSSICNFTTLVPRIYGVTPTHRVYQGMTISFDFSIEEIWPTWAVGATLVAGPTDGRRVGSGLADFLEESGITMIYCVPTVLATLDRTVDSIRVVNVGGEACPPELVERWGRGRRILNTYGPTETTVTCTWAELEPGKRITIGKPLPTYTAQILDENLRPVPYGEVGEICVGGPGVARGYVNRPDLTAERFVHDPQRPDGGRIYRTGDVGRYLPDGEIEYLGRADAEVKVRGHRVDLQEIESVLAEDDRLSAAVATLLPEEGAGGGELSGYLVLERSVAADAEALAVLVDDLHARARQRLPSYMVPAYLEPIDAVPMLPSGKIDRGLLPAPQRPRLIGGNGEQVTAGSPTEARIAAVWAEVLGVPPEAVSVEADFFTDLGGHSLLAATVISRLRSEQAGGGLSVMDLYSHPTVRALARHQDTLAGETSDSEVAQLGWLYALLVVFLLPIGLVYGLNDGVPSWTLVGQLVAALPLAYLVGRWALPVVAVRVLSRGISQGTHPLWGAVHLRVWAVQRVMALSPLMMLSGSPWAETYLRLTGARVGQACHIGSAEIPLPHLLRLHDGATIGYAAHLRAYEVADGVLTVGTVEIGRNAVVGANTVVQGPGRVGDEAMLHELSLLPSGQEVPDGEAWVGSPARPREGAGDPVLELMTECRVAPRSWPRELLPWFALGLAALEAMPLVALAPVVVLVWWTLLEQGELAALVVTALSGPVFVLTTCVLLVLVRRLALPATPVGVHHLRSQLGMEKWFGDKLLQLSLQLNNTLYSTLYTPMWLRALGARVGRGAEVSTIADIDPDLLVLEDDCFVADMASVGSATYGNGHVALRATDVGERAFVGNAAFVPSGTHLADGSLVGVLSVPPVGGVEPGTSWLGSPPFYLPQRQMYDQFTEEQTFRPSQRQVRARYAIEFFRVVMPASLLAVSTFATLYTLSLVAGAAPTWAVVLATPLVALTASLGVVAFVAGLKWTVVGRYRARVEPLWSTFVRRTEFVTGIYEAAAVPALLNVLTGTPLLGPLLGLFGVRVGRRSLIETTYVTEFDLVRLGDDVAVGPAASLQTHLFEDRVMKMSAVTLRDRASVGTRAVVLYDTVVGEDATLAPLSLVMKGETLPHGTTWRGIPAQSAPRRPRLQPDRTARPARTATPDATA
jgi:non-ribosomal peptide synthetase-like protein